MKEVKITKQMLRGGMQERNRRREICKFNSAVKEYNKSVVLPKVKDGFEIKSMSSITTMESDFEKIKPKLKKTRSRFGWFDYE